MGDVKWTKEQSSAIHTRDCNLLVAAAAGSGKTAVLVQRIIEMITHKENPVDIDRLLIVTFTNAAASEMRERIGMAISKAINLAQKENDYNSSKNLQRQLTLLNRSSITTIHSFCLEVIKNNFHMLDIDPGFRVCDPTEIELIKNEALEEVFEEKYIRMQEGEKDFETLVEAFCSNRDDIALKEIILSIFNKIMSLPEPFKWLEEKCEEFNLGNRESMDGTVWGEILIQDVISELRGIYLQMEEGVNVVQSCEELFPNEETFKQELELIGTAIHLGTIGLNEMIRSVNNISFGRLKTIRNIKDKRSKDRATDIRNTVKKNIEKIKDRLNNSCGKSAVEDINSMYGIMNALKELIISFNNEFKRKKRERGIIDFTDFEHYALDLLVSKEENGEKIIKDGWYIPSNPAKELRSKYDEILIDEYQDSNMVQEVILNMISREPIGEPNIFMVGDVKQSIYKFRQANPKLFMDKYERYSIEEEGKYRKILLYKNFRSRENIVNSVNFIFELIMSKEAGELEYDEKERLNFGAFFGNEEDVEGHISGDVELHMIEMENPDNEENDFEDDSDEEELSKIQVEARFIANKISELISNKEYFVFDKKINEYRNPQFRDIVILLRSTSTSSEIIMEELKKREIPVYADVGNGYFEAVEVKTVLSLLHIVDNPMQDIHLIATMRSPIGGFLPEDFVDIRKCNPKESFYEACVKYRDGDVNAEEEIELREELQYALKVFINNLEVWREKSRYMPLDQFIWMLITETGYFGFVGSLGGGIQKQGNLKVLYQRAKNFENTSYKGLFNFINFINKLKKSSGDMGAAKVIGENENVVRIMSIHKSKGLEFPIVFLSTLGKQFNLQDLNGNILFHDKLGFGPDYVNLNMRISYPTLYKEIIKSKMKKETISEEMRILYVAFTRAREKLILTSTVKDIDKYLKSIAKGLLHDNKKIISSSVLGCKSYLDWIVSALLLHKDGKNLRERNEFLITETFSMFNHDSRWSVHFWDRYEIIDMLIEKSGTEEEKISQKIFKLLSEPTKNKYRDAVDDRLSYKYKFQEAIGLPTVMTVTELKKREQTMERFNEEEVTKERVIPSLKKRPLFMEEKKGLTPAEKGTAMHNVVQYIDFVKTESIDDIKKQINDMIDKELITFEEGNSVNPNKILNLVKSEIGLEIINALREGRLYRERQFALNIKAYEIFEELGGLEHGGRYNDDTIKLQGIIDLYIEEEDGLILIDYKTDYVTEETLHEIIEKYRSQLKYYSEALEYVTGKKVKERYLYLFGIDRAVLVH
ncbi:helicase-exonuclease AddAB subunit AddA [Oceanirhabdus sp. W0125-5]|uniref:helicase-exonuclease AddAB subunit AddA n=1 Tax=Oceanirhabdus sp. W0125-5 TaxID=2999116 RepID=UPI0022F2C37B|nr:helicase-exonuclease AddAB subunit AddA [Oceanirhabdus sp. W0125-5]WBW99258.1 helicase-exonuclease AddAB subunit AddA [Oceanirhabdus sp. W0125-5]